MNLSAVKYSNTKSIDASMHLNGEKFQAALDPYHMNLSGTR